MDDRVILSNRGKVSWGRAAVVAVCVLLLGAMGVFMMGQYMESHKEKERFFLFGVAIVAFAMCIYAVVQFVMQQKSFLELKVGGVCGAAFSPDAKAFTITLPRFFELAYADIQRVDFENGFILLVTNSGTYRCRDASMGQQFASEIKKAKEV